MLISLNTSWSNSCKRVHKIKASQEPDKFGRENKYMIAISYVMFIKISTNKMFELLPMDDSEDTFGEELRKGMRQCATIAIMFTS